LGNKQSVKRVGVVQRKFTGFIANYSVVGQV